MPPHVFSSEPKLDELLAYMNRRAAIDRLSSNDVSLSSPESSIALSGSLSWHRPYDFRLQAHPSASLILGDALDAGSNADKFWMLIKPPGEAAQLFYASHQEFEYQTGPRYYLPVSPLWIREALGVVEFDPNGYHEGPIRRDDNLIEIRSVIPTHRGSYKRIAVIEPTRATLQQLILKDPDNREVAVAHQSEHYYYSAIDATLPHRVDIVLHPDGGNTLAFTIKVSNYILNQANGNETLRYTMPESTGYQTRDLVQENARMMQTSQVSGAEPIPQPPAPASMPPRTAATPIFNPLQNYR